MRLPLRILLALAAIAACVPLGFWLSAAALEQQADEVLKERAGSFDRRLERARPILEKAATRTPSTDPELLLVQAYLFGSQFDRAAPLLRKLSRTEPDNVEVWSLLAIATERSDPGEAARARARARELSPPVDG